MRISTRGQYGLEAVLCVALNSHYGHVSIKTISEMCRVSEAYIMQLFIKLRKAGIINSIRGSSGGYYLAKSASKITVKDILDVLEDSIAPVDCVKINGKSKCERFEHCATKEIWKSIMENINYITSSINIENLVESYRTMEGTNKPENLEIDYYI